jgi:hypothetical protein
MRFWILLMLGLSAGVTAGVARIARAQTPPTRVFGTVTIDGQPAPLGTIVQAVVNDHLCGEGPVRYVNDQLPQGYVVDVLSFSSSQGCGTDGDTVTFRVGGVQANETATFQSGAFVRLDLTVSGQVATPTAGPTPAPFGEGAASPTAVPTAAPTVAPASPTAGGASPTAAASPSATGSPTETAGPSPSSTATISATGSPLPRFTATPSLFPNSGTTSGGISPWVWVGVGLGVLAVAGGAAFWVIRRRGVA